MLRYRNARRFQALCELPRFLLIGLGGGLQTFVLELNSLQLAFCERIGSVQSQDRCCGHHGIDSFQPYAWRSVL